MYITKEENKKYQEILNSDLYAEVLTLKSEVSKLKSEKKVAIRRYHSVLKKGIAILREHKDTGMFVRIQKATYYGNLEYRKMDILIESESLSHGIRSKLLILIDKLIHHNLEKASEMLSTYRRKSGAIQSLLAKRTIDHKEAISKYENKFVRLRKAIQETWFPLLSIHTIKKIIN